MHDPHSPPDGGASCGAGHLDPASQSFQQRSWSGPCSPGRSPTRRRAPVAPSLPESDWSEVSVKFFFHLPERRGFGSVRGVFPIKTMEPDSRKIRGRSMGNVCDQLIFWRSRIVKASMTCSAIRAPSVGWMVSSQRKKPTFGGVGRSNLKCPSFIWISLWYSFFCFDRR